MNDLDYVLQTIDPWLDKYINAGPDSLAPIELLAVGVWMLEAEVNNGGFDQYYFNSAGDMAIRTVDSLKSIGATNTASLLAAANAEFQNSAPPTDRTLRQDLLEEMRDRVSFSPLEQEFFQDQERLMSRLANHLRTHFAQQAGLS